MTFSVAHENPKKPNRHDTTRHGLNEKTLLKRFSSNHFFLLKQNIASLGLTEKNTVKHRFLRKKNLAITAAIEPERTFDPLNN